MQDMQYCKNILNLTLCLSIAYYMYINIVFCNLLNISRHELMLIAKLFVKKTTTKKYNPLFN